MIVLDASFVLEVMLETPTGRRHADRLFGQERHAPHLIDLEFTQALRRLTQAGELSTERSTLILDLYGKLALIRHSHILFLSRIWELRTSISAYDAAYVALAEALDMPLLTCDAKLARSHGHHARIELLSR